MLYKKRKTLINISVPCIIFCIGAGIFLYPTISNYLLLQKSKTIIHHYDTKIAEQSKSEIELAWKNAKLYNENLAGDPVHDPFVLESGYVLPNDYFSVLNIDQDGIMGYIKIPDINVKLPIYHGTTEDVLKKGVGHLQNTSLPSGGENCYAVLCAHRGLPSGELFTRLDELKKGDLFYIHILDEIHTYEIYDIQTIEPIALHSLLPEKGLDKITLMTCTPYAVNSHRLIVTGKRIPTKEEAIQHEEEWNPFMQTALISIIILIIFLCFMLFFRRLKKKKVKV